MLKRLPSIAERALRGLHPKAIDDPNEIQRLLGRAGLLRTPLYRGLNADIDIETAFIELVTERSLVLETSNFDQRANYAQIFLRFDCDDCPYFFATRRLGVAEPGRLIVEIPRTMFFRERRDRSRRSPDPKVGDSRLVEVTVSGEGGCEGRIQDLSTSGMGLLVPEGSVVRANCRVTVRYLDGRDHGQQADFEVRSASTAAERLGWKRIGLARAGSTTRELINIEYWDSFACAEMADAEPVGELAPQEPLDDPHVMRLDVPGSDGGLEELVCLVDRWGDPSGATAVVITNGWGQAKEAFLPLARTLVSTFRAHSLPIEVVRFDGIRKRGESYVDPECRVPGRETQNFVFSQGVRDIEALVKHLRESSAAWREPLGARQLQRFGDRGSEGGREGRRAKDRRLGQCGRVAGSTVDGEVDFGRHRLCRGTRAGGFVRGPGAARHPGRYRPDGGGRGSSRHVVH